MRAPSSDFRTSGLTAMVLGQPAAANEHDIALRFLIDGEEKALTFTRQDLRERSHLRARQLAEAGAAGEPVLLLEPPGPAFVTGLLGCWLAGAIAVPAYPPRGGRHRRRLAAIRHDCAARLALGPSDLMAGASGAALAGLILLGEQAAESGETFDGAAPHPGTPCLLQYTSGSTEKPKGVVLHHGHLQSHLAAMEASWGSARPASALSWLPPYHDMGLVLKILHSLAAGMPLTWFSADHFIQRPVRWLRAIHRYRAEFSGGPNFAFDLCARSIADEDLAGLDLSCWRAAPCGAERVRADTLERFARRFEPYGFRRDAFLPGYGLAEATLTVTARRPGSPLRVSRHPEAGLQVSCGPPLEGMSVTIEDPVSWTELAPEEIGEIVVEGPGVAAGYWRRDSESDTFSSAGCLRTGDRGYLDPHGELHVVGRLKDLIILEGVNIAPEDLESTVAAAVPRVSACAAFASETDEGEAVVLAIEAAGIAASEFAALTCEVRRCLARKRDIDIHRVVVARTGTIPRTTSGKVRRSATRDALEMGGLPLLHDDGAARVAATGGALQDLVMSTVREVTGRSGISAEDDCFRCGLSSMEATRLAALLRAATGVSLPLVEIFEASSFRQLAQRLADAPRSDQLSVLPMAGESGLVTHSQERMGFLHRLDPDSAAYHIFGALDLDGSLDEAALEGALQDLMKRHVMLRSRHMITDEGTVVCVPDGMAPPPLRIVDGDADEQLREFALEPFRLSEEPPVRALLVRVGTGASFILGLCVHHIAADGWSMRILARDLAGAYAARRGCGAPLPPPPSPDYLSYASWHRRQIDAGASNASIDYWRTRLAGHPGLSTLATDFPRPPKPSSRGGVVHRDLPADLAARIGALAQAHRATPFMVQMAVYLLILRRHGAGSDQVIAVPVANRHHAEAGDLVGTLVNTLPFRLAVDPGESFTRLLERVRDAAFEMQEHQDAPFERIIEAVRPGRSPDHSPLAQVMFDHQELPLPENWGDGLRCRPRNIHRGAVQFDLSLLHSVMPSGQQIAIEYRGDLFRKETAVALLDRYLATLDDVCRAPERLVSEIECLSEADHSLLSTCGRGPQHPDYPATTAPAHISATAALHPQKTAIVCGEERIDQATLQARSSALARGLAARGVRPGDRVALLLERDLLLPVALLAVWKCGAAYVPLDAANPPERLALVLEDQAPVHVLVSPSLTGRLPRTTETIVMDSSLLEDPGPEPVASPRAEDPAYVLYTSGSTGRPKGVVVSHGALANFLLSMRDQPGFREDQRLMAVTTVSFDISALEIHLPLLAGGTVDLVNGTTAADPVALMARMEQTRPDVMQATPATWRMLLDAGWQGQPGLKILCGGEALDLPLARRLVVAGAELWNLYGPTETTVWSSLWQVPHDPARISVGHAIANTGLHIVTEDGTASPPGIPGELLISGAGLAEGYWKRPELTAARFAPLSAAGDVLAYRTGDLARWLPDGGIECLGRLDGQVKVRGFRVELGEIEAAMVSHPGVAEAAVTLDGDRLVGWYRAVASADAPTDLTSHLRARLPSYMVPAPLVALDRLPLTSSGKVDRKALAARPLPASDDAQLATASSGDALERELCDAWAVVLQQPSVGLHDDFFVLGGHSLLAAKLVTEVKRRTGVTVALDWLFDQPTPAGMAAHLRTEAAPDLAQPRVLTLAAGRGGVPLFWCHTLVDGGMGLLPYRETARILADVTDSYGIAEGTGTFPTLAAMAAAHVERIRTVQPQGPYRLAGFCFGGNLAAEVAAQLADAGEEIELLCLLEASPPCGGRRCGWWSVDTWKRIFSRLPARVRSLLQKDRATALRRLRMKRRAAANEWGRWSGRNEIPDLRGILDLDALDPPARERAMRHWEALHRHEPRLPAARRIVLLRAADDGWRPRPARLGWRPGADIEEHTVPGRHEDFLRHHSAKEVADVLRQVFSP